MQRDVGHPLAWPMNTEQRRTRVGVGQEIEVSPVNQRAAGGQLGQGDQRRATQRTRRRLVAQRQPDEHVHRVIDGVHAQGPRGFVQAGEGRGVGPKIDVGERPAESREPFGEVFRAARAHRLDHQALDEPRRAAHRLVRARWELAAQDVVDERQPEVKALGIAGEARGHRLAQLRATLLERSLEPNNVDAIAQRRAATVVFH